MSFLGADSANCGAAKKQTAPATEQGLACAKTGKEEECIGRGGDGDDERHSLCGGWGGEVGKVTCKSKAKWHEEFVVGTGVFNKGCVGVRM